MLSHAFLFFLSGLVTCYYYKPKSLGSSNDGMTVVAVLLFSIVTASAANNSLYAHNADSCETKILTEPRTAAGLNTDISYVINKIVIDISQNNSNFTDISQQLLSAHPEIAGIILSSALRQPTLSLNIRERLKIFPNRTITTDVFWKVFDTSSNGWAPPFRDCYIFKETWFYAYVLKSSDVGLALFLPLQLDQCDFGLSDIFGGPNQCDDDTTYVSILFQLVFMCLI